MECPDDAATPKGSLPTLNISSLEEEFEELTMGRFDIQAANDAPGAPKEAAAGDGAIVAIDP